MLDVRNRWRPCENAAVPVSSCDDGRPLEEPQYQGFNRGLVVPPRGAQVPANCIAFIVFAMPRMPITRFPAEECGSPTTRL